MKENREFIEAKQEELMKKTALLMVECMGLMEEETKESRQKYRELIEAFLDLAMYNDEWNGSDNRVLATAIAQYLKTCRTLLKAER